MTSLVGWLWYRQCIVKRVRHHLRRFDAAPTHASPPLAALERNLASNHLFCPSVNIIMPSPSSSLKTSNGETMAAWRSPAAADGGEAMTRGDSRNLAAAKSCNKLENLDNTSYQSRRSNSPGPKLAARRALIWWRAAGRRNIAYKHGAIQTW